MPEPSFSYLSDSKQAHGCTKGLQPHVKGGTLPRFTSPYHPQVNPHLTGKHPRARGSHCQQTAEPCPTGPFEMQMRPRNAPWSILFMFSKYVDTSLCNIIANKAIHTGDHSQCHSHTNNWLLRISPNLFADFSLGS